MVFALAGFYIVVLALSANADQLRICLKNIADKYFTEESLVVLYWNGPGLQKKMLLQEDMNVNFSEDNIIKYFSERRKWTLKVYNGKLTEAQVLKPDYRTRHTILLIDSDMTANLSNLMQEMNISKKVMTWRAQGQILVIVREKEKGDVMAVARLVLEALWGFTKASNTAVLIVNKQDEFKIYKWYPYTDHCDKVGNITLINTWVNGDFKEQSELFVKDGITNLNGCPLKVGAFPNPPYILNPIGSRTNFTNGLEIKIFEQLSMLFNFTMNYTTLPEGKFPYVIFDSDGNPSGFHAMLFRQELDIMIFGCRIHELRNMLADPLDSYAEDALVWVVPSPGIVPSWRNLGDAFTPTVWLVFGIFFVLISTTLYIIANYQLETEEHSTLRSYVSCILSSLGVLLNNSVPQPKSALLRFYMVIFSLFAINTNSAYQSSLIALLTSTRHEKPYVTPMDAVQDGIKTYLFPSGNITYNQTDHNMWNIIFQPGRHAFIEDFEPVIKEIALNKTAMVMMAENVAGFEIRTKYMMHDNTPGAMFLKEKFSLYRVTTYVSAGHPLREHFRRKVNQLLESGLTEYWLKDVYITSFENFVGKQEEEGTQPLTMEHLQGAFYILLIASAASIHVFCFELLFQKIIHGIYT